MKILAIRIKNLASLEGTTEIDFTAEPLCSAGIFAITGATGAGKSTILDALCLALYGKTPRYLQAKETGIEIKDIQGSTLSQGDVRGILRDGTAEGFAEVDFVGTDGQRYRANWSVRRARNKADGSLQSDSVTLKNITANTDIPGKKQETLTEITRLVGLNFEQFTRSVLLAQGDFTAFMKANRDEKSSLLEKLTGTHIYSEISKKVYEKHKSEEQQLRDLNLRKEGIITLTEEELKTLSDEQEILEAQIKSLEKDCETLSAEISWHEQLAKLLTAHHEAHTYLQRAAEAKTLALPQQQKLVVVEQAQQTRSWADALLQAQQQHSQKTTTFTTLNAALTDLQAQKENLETQLKLAEGRLTEKSKALTDSLPLLAQAKRLDTLLTEKKGQVEKLKEASDTALEAYNLQQILLKGKQGELTSLGDQIKTISDWKANNTSKSPIAENKDLILSKLTDAQTLVEALQSSTAKLVQLQDKIKTGETEKTIIEGSWTAQSGTLADLKKNYDTKAAELRLIPIEKLNIGKTEADGQVEEMIKAQAHWQLTYHALLELGNLNQKQAEDQSNYQTKLEALQKLALQLPIENAQKDTAYEFVQQARQASNANVKTLRETLSEGTPCPVCGSEHHPYVADHPQLENVLAQLEKSYREKEQSYLDCRSQHDKLEQESHALKQTIQQRDEDIQSKQAVLQTKKQAWAQFNCEKESRDIADPKKADWIEGQLQALKTKQTDLLVQLQAYNDSKLQLDAAKTEIDRLKENTDGLQIQISDIQSRLSVYLEQLSNTVKEQDKASLDLGNIENLLSSYFTAANWMEEWKSDTAAFVNGIEAFAREWTESTKKLEQYVNQQAILEATLKELGNQVKNLAAEAGKKNEEYLAQQAVLSGLQQERSGIFAGQAADETEAHLKQAQTEAQGQLEQLRDKLQQLNIESTRAHTQKEELAAAITALENEVQKALQKIQAWLDDYNQNNSQSLSIEVLHELLALPNDWINSERAILKAIDEEVTKAESVLKERKQAFDNHKLNAASGRTPEELTVLFSVAKTEEEQKKNQKAANIFRLQQDEAHKKQVGDLLKNIAAQAAVTENWSKLNEIIGSADGKKFRQVAQEYTLDVLLGYANFHLQALTSRYKIERIPASLGLQVVDQDMGDEVRTVYSLSGGESFLVSLALALGLASLSSSRMKVESLFIDEGFGSLDPTTLNIAMDALERLHNQGRKVGVISHVQEMTERIPVQIKVSKMQSGKSMVEVLGM